MQEKENNKDPFLWRKQGFRFEIGDDENEGVSAMVPMDDNIICVMRRSIHSISLADSIDPNRVNPSIPNSQQKLIAYGSDDSMVGRTFLQADILFKEHSLPSEIDRLSALNLAFSFLKEVISLQEATASYVEDESAKNTSFTGHIGSDQSLKIPSIHNLEQITKLFLVNVDHATSYLMRLTQLFYPDIANTKWSKNLFEKLKKERGEQDQFTKFSDAMSGWVWCMRNLRNAVEHQMPENIVEIQNYKLNAEGKVSLPTIFYNNNETPLNKIALSRFMVDSVEELQFYFENLMAYLCNTHALPFVNTPRLVVETSVVDRPPHQKHVRFGYYIALTD